MKGCVDALRACKKGSHSRAITIIKEVCRGKTNCEDPYIIQGKIFTDYVREIADGRLKHRILKEAAESCKRATELYPYSIDLGFAYAGFLYELCDYGNGYEELAQECKRALSIEPEAHNSSGKGMGSGGFEPDLTVEETREALLAMLEVCQWKINEMVLNEGRAYTEDVMVMKQRVQIYLNSMVDTEKTELVRVVLSDLEAHFKDHTVLGIKVSEIFSFAKDNQSWWSQLACRHCEDTFLDFMSYREHISHTCMAAGITLSSELASVIPIQVRRDSHWFSNKTMVGTWEPIDISEALQCIHHSHSNNSSTTEEVETQEWPLSDDPKRRMFLGKIHDMFSTLLGRHCLAESHLHLVMRYAKTELQTILSSSQLLCLHLDETPLGIRFLGVDHLQRLLYHLLVVIQAASDKRYEFMVAVADDFPIKASYNGREVTFVIHDGDYALPAETETQTDFLVSWLYSGPNSVGELENFCSRQRELNKQRGEQILELLGKNHTCLTSLCAKKRELVGYEKALEAYLNEFEEMGEHPRSYVSFMESRSQELQEEATTRTLSHSGRFELDVIANILDEVYLRDYQLKKDKQVLESDKDEESTDYLFTALSKKIERDQNRLEVCIYIYIYL